jgi:hypothetical protein
MPPVASLFLPPPPRRWRLRRKGDGRRAFDGGRSAIGDSLMGAHLDLQEGSCDVT